jgi:hypothetical protein
MQVVIGMNIFMPGRSMRTSPGSRPSQCSAPTLNKAPSTTRMSPAPMRKRPVPSMPSL